MPEKGEFRIKQGLGSSEPMILYLGRIHENKGIDLLVKAFSGLARRLPEAKLFIVGLDEVAS